MSNHLSPTEKLAWMTAAALMAAVFASSCSLLATRPVREMSDTGAAIRAAREVQADVMAPELYRQSMESFFKAKRHYKFKNFKQAREYAEQARVFAEQTEFEATRNGANRSDRGGANSYTELSPSSAPTDSPPAPNGSPSGGSPPPLRDVKTEPYLYPTPEPIPATSFDGPPVGQPSSIPPG